jgi:hypothetical protein
MQLPNGFVHVPLTGKDSAVGEIRGHGMIVGYDDYGAKMGGRECSLPKTKRHYPLMLSKVLDLPGRKVCYWMEFADPDREYDLCDGDDACVERAYRLQRRRLKGWMQAEVNGMSFSSHVEGKAQVDLFVRLISGYVPPVQTQRRPRR